MLENADMVKDRHSQRLLSTPGVSAVGVERSETGGGQLVVHLDKGHEQLATSLPAELDGVPVRYVVDGPFWPHRR